MAANKSVTVLAPNGRRQNVKITPNTTILQVLEEVCQKQGFSSKKWDLKHFNQTLDSSSIFRFTGLPNNAQLEMVQRSKERELSSVTIGVQLENGQRVMGEFSSDTTLIEIVRSLCPGEEAGNMVITYMHQEIHGADNLSTTSLQSLGLSDGRAMLRLLHRDLDKLTTQAHVAGQLPSKSNKANAKPQRPGNNSHSALQQASNAASNVVSNVKNQVKKAFDPLSMLKNEKSTQNKHARGSGKRFMGGGNVLGHGNRAQVKPEPEPESESEPRNKNQGSSQETSPDADGELEVAEEVMETIEYLGERNALIFNQAQAQAIPRENLPDNFYDLTVDDAKALLRDAKRQREAFEDNPLLTNAQRELERTQSTLNKLHKYRKTIIRIQFPGQMVLQGIFGPVETVQHIKDFIKEYLETTENDFDLYVTPPKKNLSSSHRLIDEGLVPSAIIYYSGVSGLKPELRNKLVDPKIASVQAIKSRITTTRSDSQTLQDSNVNIGHSSSRDNLGDPSPGSSGSGANASGASSYAPKWFKRAFK
ncbi:tether containing UBX domain for GLUT4 [Diachasmimorpha longicaudata]|uniref:tether containing UBX domain for GLUT4 n=1 Tax=Diachasmimorpha longicaudata TaxID=58733 RepID=UPI0030B87EC8